MNTHEHLRGYDTVNKKKFLFILTIAFLLTPLHTNANELPLQAGAAVLVEHSTGLILYAHNAHQPMFPASTTKMLTALVVVEHLSLDTVIIAGEEVRNMPSGFTTNIPTYGEAMTVRMLLTGLLVPSANEAGRVLALEVVRTTEGRRDIPYMTEAKARFASLMNEKARSLGATSSNFNNPYGFHSDMHYTTAHDLAIIARAFMDNPILAEIVKLREFSGANQAGHMHSWTNTNLMLPGAPFGHPYILGLRTGYTTPAGRCFVGAAYHNGMKLISVVLHSGDPARWLDTGMLINYGFNNYGFREVLSEGQLMDTVAIDNHRRGDSDTLEVFSKQAQTALLSHEEYANLRRETTFDPLLLVEREYETVLRAPIEEGETVGTVQYISNGEVIFTSSLVASREVLERTFDSDMDYFIAMFFGNIFTKRALPYWFAVIGVLFGLMWMFFAVTISRRARRIERWNSAQARQRRR